MAVALPHLGAEAVERRERLGGSGLPLALTAMERNALRLASVTPAAAALGLTPGQGLADARAICPGLLTRPLVPDRLDTTRAALLRWAERFSPMVSFDREDVVILDISGVDHLFGGEAEMAARVAEAFGALGLTARVAIADTRGAAWALAQSAPAIAPPQRTRQVLEPLTVAALRIEAQAVEGLNALGLTTIGEVARLPRGQLARRFGLEVIRRLDQALGAEPEPVSPARARPVFSARMTFAEPIGLTRDVMAGLDHLLERVCAALERAHQGARHLRLTARRVDASDTMAEIRLARPGRDPMRLRDLFERKVGEMQAGFGIDALRLVAVETEPLKPAQTGRRQAGERLDDLLSRIGNRIGFEQVTRYLPNESHIPEHAFTTAVAAWSEAEAFPPGLPRPLVLFDPEPLGPAPERTPPRRFSWRGQAVTTHGASGPERIAPEWWWDDPAWRTGPRDYWKVQTGEGPRLWLYRSYYPAPAWWIQGVFA